MRHLAILLVGSLGACASHEAPPAASAESVQAATATPSAGPSFAPVGSDAMAAAPADARRPGTAPGPQSRPAASTGTDTATAVDTMVPPSTGNATALPTQSPPSAAYEADNSRVNARDRSGATLTPMDQGSSEADRKTTQQIRQAVVGDSSLSFTAKNVKIITINGKVTLRGSVKSDDERMKVAAAARKIAGDAQVENFLEVSK